MLYIVQKLKTFFPYIGKILRRDKKRRADALIKHIFQFSRYTPRLRYPAKPTQMRYGSMSFPAFFEI